LTWWRQNFNEWLLPNKSNIYKWN